MALRLLCSRPDARAIDFRTARFVVGKSRGLDVGERHLEMGEEVPKGAFREDTLKILYDAPLRKIETINYAFSDEALRIECIAHGVEIVVQKVKVDQPPADVDPDAAPERELVSFCRKHGISHVGTSKQLRKRVAAFLGRQRSLDHR